MKAPSPRRGYTLIEVVIVMAMLIAVGAGVIPSLAGLSGNRYQRAATDTLRGRLAEARGRAVEQGVAYRLALSGDGSRVRLAPDDENFGSAAAAEMKSVSAKVSEDAFEKATASVVSEPNPSPPAGDGWVTVATFLPDGTCREDNVTVAVSEDTFPPVHVQVRGVTGAARVLKPGETGGGRP